MQFSKLKISFLLLAAAAKPVLGRAAEATTPTDKSANYNATLLSLVGIIIILLFIIGVLAGTLKQLSFVVKDKNRGEKSAAANIVKTLLLLVGLTMTGVRAFAEDAPADPAAIALKELATQWKMPEAISGIGLIDFYIIVGIIFLELIVIFALVRYIQSMLRVLRDTPEMRMQAQALARKSWFWDKLNAAASIEKEKDILLDHDYDGIKELDNSLPPWWKYGFYLTIVIGIIYLYRFHVSHDGPSSEEEYTAEMQKGEEEKAAYLAKSANNVNENNVVALTDASDIAQGKDMFQRTCAACHVADGGGNVGPNLTDEYWLHGGGIKNVFKSIKYGWQDKGMKSWKDDYSPRQIQQLASFILTLKGTHPAAPKAPQGELYIDSDKEAASGTTADTTKAGKIAIN